MIICDRDIAALAKLGMIAPFTPTQIKASRSGLASAPRISYGLSCYGYDVRLSPEEFFIFKRNSPEPVDPKNFDTSCLIGLPLEHSSDLDQSYFTMPPHSYGLGVTLEAIAMPEYVTALAIGKSTYARCGLILNCTPIEAGWSGHITLEISNSSDAPVRIYAYEGIAQLVFFRGEKCDVSYADRKGKYQNQAHQVVSARV